MVTTEIPVNEHNHFIVQVFQNILQSFIWVLEHGYNQHPYNAS